MTVTGEAGIGKSRIAESLQERIAADRHARIHMQCSTYHTDSALYPVIQHLARAARFTPDDTAEAKLAKLAALFPADRLPLAGRSDVAAGGAVAADPGATQGRDHRLLIDAMLRLGQTKPVLLVLEDAHLIDATTLELMTRLTDSIAVGASLAVVTARPEFVPPWQARAHATLLTLAGSAAPNARSWSPASPRRMACRPKPSTPSSPRPMAFRCFPRN